MDCEFGFGVFDSMVFGVCDGEKLRLSSLFVGWNLFGVGFFF